MTCNDNCFETVRTVYVDNTGSNSAPGVTTNDLSLNTTTNTLTSTVNGVSDSVVLPAGSGAQTPITVVDSQTLDLTASGTNNSTLTGSVKISTTANNALTVNATGLFVPTASAGAQTPITVVDTPTVDLTANGLDNHTLAAAVKISPVTGNLVTSDANGLVVLAPATTNTMSFNTGNSTLTTTVNGVTATQVLPTGGTGTETPLVATDSSTLDFTTSGNNGHNLTGAVKVSAVLGNTITTNPDGLFVAAGAVITGNLLSDNTASVATGTSRLVGGNATVSVPLKIGTAGTTVTAPTTAGGYQLQSTDGSVVITNPTAGVINFASSAMNFYSADTAATGTVTATRATQSAFTHYTVTFTAPRIHVLSTTGAVLGDSMVVSVGYAGTDILPGTTNLEIRNGTATGTLIETMTDGLGIEGHYKFNGTAWVKVR